MRRVRAPAYSLHKVGLSLLWQIAGLKKGKVFRKAFSKSLICCSSQQGVSGCHIKTPCKCKLSNLTLNREGERVSGSQYNGLWTYLMTGREGTLSLRCSLVVSLKVELRLWGWSVSGKIGSWLILKFDLPICVQILVSQSWRHSSFGWLSKFNYLIVDLVNKIIN